MLVTGVELEFIDGWLNVPLIEKRDGFDFLDLVNIIEIGFVSISNMDVKVAYSSIVVILMENHVIIYID